MYGWMYMLHGWWMYCKLFQQKHLLPHKVHRMVQYPIYTMFHFQLMLLQKKLLCQRYLLPPAAATDASCLVILWNTPPDSVSNIKFPPWPFVLHILVIATSPSSHLVPCHPGKIVRRTRSPSPGFPLRGQYHSHVDRPVPCSLAARPLQY